MGFNESSREAPYPHWRRVKLGDVLPLNYGKGLPEKQRQPGSVAVFGSSGRVGTHNVALIERPAIIVGRKGSAGSVHLCETPSWPIDTAYFAVGTDEIDLRFGFYLLVFLRLNELDQSTAIPSLSRDIYSAIEVWLPPVNEQRHIVAAIEGLFGEIEAGEQELAAAKADLQRYRRAVLKAAVTGELTRDWREQNAPTETGADLLARILKERRARWEEAERTKFAAKGQTPKNDAWRSRYPEPAVPNTDDLPELPEGWTWASPAQIAAYRRHSLAIGPFGSNLKVSDYTADGVPLVFVRHIRAKDFQGLNPQFVSQQKANELAAHSIVSGDVVITKMGDPPGDAAVYPRGAADAIITADCIKVRTHPDVIAEYVELAINSPLGQTAFSKITKGVAQQKVTLEAFSSIALPIPPSEETRQIVDVVTSLEEALAEMRIATAGAENDSAHLRQSILNAAFSGKLTAGATARAGREADAA